MSKPRVVIEIDGVRWGMNISAERAVDLFGALHEVAVEAQKDWRSAVSSNKRNAARESFEALLSEISFSAKRAS